MTERPPPGDDGVDALVRAGRWDEALSTLYALREASPGDPAILKRVQAVRDQMTAAALDKLRPLDRVPTRVGATAPVTPAETYVLDCVDGTASIDVILDRSTLGRHRTAQALEALLRGGYIAMPKGAASDGTSRRPTSDAPSEARVVVVADSNPTHAALARTLTRLAVPTGRIVSATSGAELVDLVTRERAALVVTAFQLTGFDALAALRQLASKGRPTPAIILVEQLDASFVQPKLPDAAIMLVRPFDKGTLRNAIGSLNPSLIAPV